MVVFHFIIFRLIVLLCADHLLVLYLPVGFETFSDILPSYMKKTKIQQLLPHLKT